MKDLVKNSLKNDQGQGHMIIKRKTYTFIIHLQTESLGGNNKQTATTGINQTDCQLDNVSVINVSHTRTHIRRTAAYMTHLLTEVEISPGRHSESIIIAERVHRRKSLDQSNQPLDYIPKQFRVVRTLDRKENNDDRVLP